jgi:hypothetical protein
MISPYHLIFVIKKWGLNRNNAHDSFIHAMNISIMPMKWFCYNGLEPSEPNYLTSKSKLKKLAGSKHVMRAVTVRPNQPNLAATSTSLRQPPNIASPLLSKLS